MGLSEINIEFRMIFFPLPERDDVCEHYHMCQTLCVFVYVFVCICIFVCLCIYVFVYLFVCVFVCLCICVFYI